MKLTVAYFTFAVFCPVFQQAAIIVVDALVVQAGPAEVSKIRRRGSSSRSGGSLNGGCR